MNLTPLFRPHYSGGLHHAIAPELHVGIRSKDRLAVVAAQDDVLRAAGMK
jgi:hypothetical protein